MLNNIFDAHAHYDDKWFDEDRDDLLSSMPGNGVCGIVNASVDLTTARTAIAYAEKYDFMYACAGIHPENLEGLQDDYLEQLAELYKHPKVLAIGEIGLDYYYDLSDRSVQREVFEKQLILAKEYDVPFILHERDATGDCLDILRRFYKEGRLRSLPGVCHCCSCSLEASQELVKMGFYLGFDGPLTFKNNKKTPEVALNTPWDRIVIETDSPYLTPEPNRGLINEPCHVAYVCAKIAEIKGVTIDEAAQITYDNGKKLYGVD